jgi:hypothetical protein
MIVSKSIKETNQNEWLVDDDNMDPDRIDSNISEMNERIMERNKH